MRKIISVSKAALLSKTLRAENKKIVLVGGCFDILHPGHITFLEKARKAGEALFVLLESDQKVKALKGSTRPIQNQKERAKVLSALQVVDCVVLLPFLISDADYDKVILKIKPQVIAATKNYENLKFHQRVAKITGAKLKYVTKKVGNYSTTRILEFNLL